MCYLRTISILGIFLAMLAVTTLAQAEASETKAPTLAVKGQATIRKPADEISLNIGVVSQGETAEEALKENSAKMQRVLESIVIAGLQGDEYKTGRFSIHPIYSQRPQSPPPNWQAQIIGYEVTNSIAIQTDKVKLTGEIIDQATQAGANSVGNIRFGLKEPRAFRSEAIKIATQNAITDAEALSTAADVDLVRILSLSLDDAQAISPSPRGQFYAKAMATEGVPIEAGDIEIIATVTVVYEVD
ncbi:MAG: 26 kDa periplasmic immunogenic protein [Chlamydiae bacterium]|nr:26 kDa periplasmic immunogenic protein [Chlamydiota bacterium]